MAKKVKTKHGSGKTMLLERKKCGEFKEWSNLPKRKKKQRKKRQRKKAVKKDTLPKPLPKHTANRYIPPKPL